MKISFYSVRLDEMWSFGPIICWGERDVITIGICLGWWEFGIKIIGI